MKITVAALMTTTGSRAASRSGGVTRIMIPGMCEGDVACSASASGSPPRRAPPTSRRCRRWFGQADARASYGARDIRVFAEINHVAAPGPRRILRWPSYYRDEGADVIDLGLSLGRDWLRRRAGDDRRAARRAASR